MYINRSSCLKAFSDIPYFIFLSLRNLINFCTLIMFLYWTLYVLAFISNVNCFEKINAFYFSALDQEVRCWIEMELNYLILKNFKSILPVVEGSIHKLWNDNFLVFCLFPPLRSEKLIKISFKICELEQNPLTPSPLFPVTWSMEAPPYL